MTYSYTDWIGSIGVTILLFAYFLNLKGVIKNNSFIYLLLNVIGAGFACTASLLLKYLPFVILEICWTFVSLFGLVNYFKEKRKATRRSKD